MKSLLRSAMLLGVATVAVPAFACDTPVSVCPHTSPGAFALVDQYRSAQLLVDPSSDPGRPACRKRLCRRSGATDGAADPTDRHDATDHRRRRHRRRGGTQCADRRSGSGRQDRHGRSRRPMGGVSPDRRRPSLSQRRARAGRGRCRPAWCGVRAVRPVGEDGGFPVVVVGGRARADACPTSSSPPAPTANSRRSAIGGSSSTTRIPASAAGPKSISAARRRRCMRMSSICCCG